MEKAIVSWLFAAWWLYGVINDISNYRSPRYRNPITIGLALMAVGLLAALGYVQLQQDLIVHTVNLVIGFAVVWVLWLTAVFLQIKIVRWETAVTGLGLGVIISLLLAQIYSGAQSSAEPAVSGPMSVPSLLLVAAPLTGLIVAMIAEKFRTDPQVTGAVTFMAGNICGAVLGVLIFLLAQMPEKGFLAHLIAGIFIGGAIGSATPFIAARLTDEGSI